MEGLSDINYVTRATINRDFSWSDYGLYKSINIALFISTGGFNCFKKVGILAKISSFKMISPLIRNKFEG